MMDEHQGEEADFWSGCLVSGCPGRLDQSAPLPDDDHIRLCGAPDRHAHQWRTYENCWRPDPSYFTLPD